MNKFALVVRTTNEFKNYLKLKLESFQDEYHHKHFRKTFDPHITLIYCPLFDRNKSEAISIIESGLKGILPFKIHYQGIGATIFNSVNVNVQSDVDLQDIHSKILHEFMPDFDKLNLDERFSVFNTSNLGKDYSPHLTIELFNSQKEADIFLETCNDFSPFTQLITELEIVDATTSPMIFWKLVK